MTRSPKFNPRILLCISPPSFQEFDHGEVGDAFIECGRTDNRELRRGPAPWHELQPGDTCEYEVGDHVSGVAEIVSVGEDKGELTIFRVKKVS
jgi:hypothetical protein